MFGEIESLVRKIDYSSMKAERSIKKVASTGDPVRQASSNNAGAGTVNMAVNLENQKRFKRGSMNAFQNAMTFMQAQAEAIGQADKIYNQMRTLAQMATDPTLNDQDRAVLSDQFNLLRDEARSVGNSKFNNNFLFDGRAASTKYEIDFSSGLNDASDKTGKSPLPGSPLPTADVWESTRDVIYNTGKITLDVNSGTTGERYLLMQGDSVLFDTGNWDTEGSAYTTDFDRFVVEWGPDKDTTFQFIPQDTNGNGAFDNEPWYLNNLGIASWDASMSAVKREELGQVKAYASDPNSTELTVRIESTSWFRIETEYELPEVEPTYVGGKGDLQAEIDKLGLGLMRENKGSFPLIKIDTLQDAKSALTSMSNELEGLSKQLGVLASNINRVHTAFGVSEEMEHAHDKVLSGIGSEGFTNDLLEISKARINRAQDTALLTQAMSIHQDLVNVLI